MLKEFISNSFLSPSSRSKCFDLCNDDRIQFIDLAKGVCILLVVTLHAGIGTDFPALRSLRMPMYFILSGLFFKDYGCFINFLIKKTNKIFIPFVVFGALGVGLAVYLDGKDLWSVIIMPFITPWMQNNSVWFLICLFWTNILFYTIRIMTHANNLGVSTCVLLCGFVGSLLFKFDIYLPLFVASAFTALPFFYVGVLIRKVPLLYKTNRDRMYLVLAILMTISVSCPEKS